MLHNRAARRRLVVVARRREAQSITPPHHTTPTGAFRVVVPMPPPGSIPSMFMETHRQVIGRLLVSPAAGPGWTGELARQHLEEGVEEATRLRNTYHIIRHHTMKQPGPATQRIATHLLQEGPFPARVLEEIKSYRGNE